MMFKRTQGSLRAHLALSLSLFFTHDHNIPKQTQKPSGQVYQNEILLWLFLKTSQTLLNVSVSDSIYSEEINYIIAMKKFRFYYRVFCFLFLYSVSFSVGPVPYKGPLKKILDSIFAIEIF